MEGSQEFNGIDVEMGLMEHTALVLDMIPDKQETGLVVEDPMSQVERNPMVLQVQLQLAGSMALWLNKAGLVLDTALP